MTPCPTYAAQNRLRVLDLFSGIGGFSLGLEWAGMMTTQFVERDPKAQRILRKHWPDTPIHEDVKTYEGRDRSADVICGGFPCQRFSTATRGRATAEDLWPEMRRIINNVRPIWVVAENVPRVGYDYPSRELEAIGYTVWPLRLDASPRGRRHRRRRAVFIAHSNTHGKPGCPFNAEMGDVQSASGRSGHVEPLPLGVANGLPRELDRLQLLGNSFSPVWAEAIGRAIVASEQAKRLAA